MGSSFKENAMDFLTDAEAARIQNEFRIPVDSHYPGTFWIVSLDRESFLPTDAELRQIRSYCEFVVRSYYNESYQERILGKPLPADSGHHTIIFCKGRGRQMATKERWGYRRRTWDTGPMYQPTLDQKPHTLVEVMNRMETIASTRSEKWEGWKRQHPDIFIATNPTAG